MHNDPLLLSNHLFYAFCITLLVKIEILKFVQRFIIAYPSMEITNQFKASLLLLLRYTTAILVVMSCFFVCQSVTSQCSIKTSGQIELFLLWWLPTTSTKG